MADNLAITPGSGATVGMDEVVDGTLGTVKVAYGKIMDGTLDGTNKLTITSGGAAKTDGSATTQPVSASSLPLPSGASTAAKQPALGTAGSASADVLTVQGVASMTALKTDSSATTQPVSGTVGVTGVSTAANQTTGNTSLASIDTKTPSLGSAVKANSVPIIPATDPDIRPSSSNITVVDSGTTTTAGFNSVNVYTGTPTANSYVQQAVNGAAAFRCTISGTFVATAQFEISSDGGTSWTTTGPLGSGTVYRVGGITNIGHFYGDCGGATHVRLRCTAYTSGTMTAQFTITAAQGPVKIDSPTSLADNVTGAQHTIKAASTGAAVATDTAMVVNLREGIPAGSAAIGTVAASNLPTTVDTNSGNKSASTLRVVLATDQPANTTALKVDGSAVTQPVSGTVSVNALPTGTNTIGTVTLVAWSVSSQTSLTTTATVSSATGRYGGASFINLNSAPAYLQIFDTTGAVTLGTTTPTFVQPIPAASTAANGSGFVFDITKGITITNGIKIAATTTATGATTVSTGLTGYVLYV